MRLKCSPPRPCTGALGGRSASSGYSTSIEGSVRAKEFSGSSCLSSSFRSCVLPWKARSEGMAGDERAAAGARPALVVARAARAAPRINCDRNMVWGKRGEEGVNEQINNNWGDMYWGSVEMSRIEVETVAYGRRGMTFVLLSTAADPLQKLK